MEVRRNKFEKEKHVSFKTFASKRIVGEMYDDIRRMRYGTVRNPKKTEQFSEKNEIPISYDQEIFYEEITSPLTSKEKEIFILYYRCNYNQKEIAEKVKKALNEGGAFEKPIVTEITAFTNFFKAEDYHQDYYNLHGEQPYCKFVIQPKVEKFEKVFKKLLAK